jgi:hypothetical protein
MGYPGTHKKYGPCQVCGFEVKKIENSNLFEPHVTRGTRRWHQKCFDSLFIVSKDDVE